MPETESWASLGIHPALKVRRLSRPIFPCAMIRPERSMRHRNIGKRAYPRIAGFKQRMLSIGQNALHCAEHELR
jgi:hypothetical protein